MQEQTAYLILWAALSVWALGQIWFAQIVVYPLFAKVGEGDYIALSLLLYEPHSAGGDRARLCQLPLAAAARLVRSGRSSLDERGKYGLRRCWPAGHGPAGDPAPQPSRRGRQERQGDRRADPLGLAE